MHKCLAPYLEKRGVACDGLCLSLYISSSSSRQSGGGDAEGVSDEVEERGVTRSSGIRSPPRKLSSARAPHLGKQDQVL